MSSMLAPVSNGAVDLPPVLDREKIDLIKQTILKGATDLELQMFVNLCNTKRLDPMTRQIYGIKTERGGLQMFASIDGLRVIAQRSGEYAGQVGPFWCGPDGEWTDVWLQAERPAAAKVGVLRKGWTEPMWGVATLRSYGKSSPTWNAMADVMLAKCAESIALRKAFPDDLSGLYVREEFDTPDAPHHEAAPRTGPAIAPQTAARPVVAAEAVDAETGELLPTNVKAMKAAILALAKRHEVENDDLKAIAEDLELPSWGALTMAQATELYEELTARIDTDEDDDPEAEVVTLPIDAPARVRGEAGDDDWSR